jgi:murein DD-endopeptidase MepM/ murein hydrolase activator NlpD
MIRARPELICAAVTAMALAATSPAPSAKRPTGAGFELTGASAVPGRAYFDGERKIRLRYRFEADRPLDLVIRVVRAGDDTAVRRLVERDVRPGDHVRRWDGRRGDRGVPADGNYVFRIGPPGHRGTAAGRFEFHDHRFPVDGDHSYGDPFGEPRSGGRVHEGQDLPASCGTPLLAARGGRVQARGYSDALYGYWVLIDGLATRRDYFYAHLRAPTPLADGARVRTGERIGEVGKTGNARNEFCQLHLELWPHGYRKSAPQDPAPLLHRWDAFS